MPPRPTTGPRPTAADLMTPTPRTCSPFSTVLEAVMIFRDADCGAVPIVKDGQPVGILTDRDVALALAEYPDLANRSVADVMSEGVVTVAPVATLEEVAETLDSRGVRRVLVVDQGGDLVGIVSRTDLARLLPGEPTGAEVTDRSGNR